MKIQLITSKISKKDLETIARDNFENMVKGVVDLQKKVIALGGELHADAEQFLLERDSSQKDLWGFNIYSDRTFENRIEYTSFINIRPHDGNRSIEITNQELKNKIKTIVDALIE